MVLKYFVDPLFAVSLRPFHPLVLLVVMAVAVFASLWFSADVFCFCGIVYRLFLQ